MILRLEDLPPEQQENARVAARARNELAAYMLDHADMVCAIIKETATVVDSSAVNLIDEFLCHYSDVMADWAIGLADREQLEEDLAKCAAQDETTT